MAIATLPDPKQAPLAIIGLGYVGLPLAVTFGAQRYTVGFDINLDRIDQLRSGHDATCQLSDQQLADATQLRLTADPTLLSTCSIYIVTVPTPIDADNQPDLMPLLRATRCLADFLKAGDLVIYESTVYPGTTEELCIPLLEANSGLRLNSDFFCGYSPERINPGDRTHDLTSICKVTSGSTPDAAVCVDTIYRTIISAGTWSAPSIRVAEAAKIIENIQRDVNIALVNELAMLFARLGIDTFDVIEAASTKWNFVPFRPGLVGGHCIGVDPYYLMHKSQSIGFPLDLIQTARQVNTRVEQHILQRISDLLAQRGRSLHGSRVLQMGITFKEDCTDLRNSRAVSLARLMRDAGVMLDICDPWADLKSASAAAQVTVTYGPQAADYHVIILAVAHHAYRQLKSEQILALAAPEAVIYDVKSIWPRTIVTARL